MPQPNSRYHRQTLLPQVTATGQARLDAARVLLIGCGALGCTLADQLARAGVGFVRLVDRDLVELTNLQRQVLFDEADAREALPKAVAAARRLGEINSAITIDPVVADVDSANLESLLDSPAGRVNLILDGTDNAETRYLINDVSVKHGIPWVYAGVVGTEGRVMPIVPGVGPCLRCVFPEPPRSGELPTCDVAGVLGPAVGIVAGLQATAALRVIIEGQGALAMGMTAIDAWAARFHRLAIDNARRPDCPCCGQRRFDFLDTPRASGAATLCGRDTVQVRPAAPTQLDLQSLAARLATAGQLTHDRFFLRLRPHDAAEMLTIFPDARVLVTGTRDPARARTLVARWLG